MKGQYMLGASPYEIERLTFQGEVWRSMTEALFDRIGVGPGWRCLDVGAGIGVVSLPLAGRVSPGGEVAALEMAPLYAETLREQIARKDIDNLRVIEEDVRSFRAPKAAYDLIYSRWVFSFLRDVEGTLKRLLPGLKKGGFLAVEDYHHLGCAYYPNRPSFDAVIEAARKWYLKTGGNYRVAGELPAIFYRLGLKRVEVTPHIRVGGPESDLWRWSELFFIGHLPAMIREKLISVGLAARFKKDLEEVKKIPGAIFVVPTIFDVVGRR
ncbi:MAG: methyltransferase domain-containing protein [Elusimicrobia bacterium]|nr:methyltransferase domain-containing protein [Elusimicrobiota bacterium]